MTVLKSDKERVVEELSERLRAADSLIVADYRGLTNAQLAGVRSKLREHGASFTVVKNTLTRRAAEVAGAESLLAMLEGPTAIAFVQAEGDPVAVAKALADTAKETKVLALRGGVLSGKVMEAADVEELAKLPPVDLLKSQLVGVIVAPLTQLVALLNAPLRDLVGLIDARVAQLEERGDVTADSVADSAEAESASAAVPEIPVASEPDDAAEATPVEAEAGVDAEASPEVGSTDAETDDGEDNAN
jgi:large subunit ribosomal protein L10